MFTNNDVGSIDVQGEAVFVGALVAKLVDIDKNRIHSNDDLVLRKAVFGLIEVMGILEQRVAALESSAVRQEWAGTLQANLASVTPDQERLGE